MESLINQNDPLASILQEPVQDVQCHRKAGLVPETIRQDRDSGGSSLCYTVFVDNLEKDLYPSTIMEFMNKQIGVTTNVYIFPILLSETFARCSIALNCAKKLDDVYELLENPNHIITSSKGKPWVVVEKKIERKINKFRSLMLPNQINNDSKNAGKLKIVHSGSKEYIKAKELKDFFKHFSTRKEQFQKKLLYSNSLRLTFLASFVITTIWPATIPSNPTVEPRIAMARRILSGEAYSVFLAMLSKS
ncbi:hypothetical protein ACFE04_028453 [Oxalis oulophora]